MPKKVREVVFALESNGWILVRRRGSHRVYKHPEHPRLVTVAGASNDNLPAGTLASIRRDSGLEDLR